MHHAPCPSLSLSFEIIFRILRRKSLESAHSGFEIVLEKKNPRVLDLRNTRVSHGKIERKLRPRRKNPPSFGRKVSILVSNFCEGKGKEIIPLVYSAMLFFFPREEKLPFFYFSQRCFSTAKERKREREKGREERGSEQNCRNGQAEAVRRWRGVKEDVRRAEGGARY